MTNKPNKAGKFITAALLAAILALSVSAQTQTITGKIVGVSDGDTLKGLQLTFELIGDAFRKDDLIEYRIKLTNVGIEPITIYNRLRVFNGLQVIVMGTTGYPLPPRVIAEPRPSFIPLTKEDFPEKYFVTLAPKESYATTSSTCMCGFFIKGSGDYLIAASYDNPVPPHLAPKGVKLWGQNDEALHTKPVKFKVIE